MGEVPAACPRANWTGFEAKRAPLWAFRCTLQQRFSNILLSVLFLKVKTNLRVPKKLREVLSWPLVPSEVLAKIPPSPGAGPSLHSLTFSTPILLPVSRFEADGGLLGTWLRSGENWGLS